MLDPEDYTFVFLFEEGEYVANCRQVVREGNRLTYFTVPLKIARRVTLLGYKVIHCDLGVISRGPLEKQVLVPDQRLEMHFPVEINLA